MARIGRGYPDRPIYVHPRLGQRHATIDLPIWETVSEWPALTVTIPDAKFTFPVWETTSEWPTLAVKKHAYVGLPVWETVSEWPTLTVSVPVLPGDLITDDFQIEWGGLVFGGAGNVYQIQNGSVEGWDDLPDLDVGDAPRAARHGSWSGPDFLQSRIVSATIMIDGPQDSSAFVLAMRNLRRAMAISEDGAERTLTIRTAGETLLAYAKSAGRAQPTDTYGQRFVAAALRWRCPRPERLDLHQQSVTIAAGDTGECGNEGDMSARPRIRIRGPVANPVLTNTTSDRILRFDITIPDGSRMDVDTDAGTVTIGGVDRMDALSNASVPVEEWVLAAGVNEIAYTVTSDGANGAEILFRSTYA